MANGYHIAPVKKGWALQTPKRCSVLHTLTPSPTTSCLPIGRHDVVDTAKYKSARHLKDGVWVVIEEPFFLLRAFFFLFHTKTLFEEMDKK